jgi:hypothetical protein
MDTKLLAVTALAVLLAVATLSFGLLYASTNSSYGSLKTQYSTLQGQYTGLETTLAPQAVLSSAMSHWNDIAIENLSLVSAGYATNATLDWIGGPLSGTYTGSAQIDSVWNKFFTLYETVYWYTITPPTVTQAVNGYQVTGYAQFFVAPAADPVHLVALNVTEHLSYVQNGQTYVISKEMWEVHPLSPDQVIAGYPPQKYMQSQVVLAQAYGHWNAIAIENATLITSEYSQGAVLHWIGGPLTGNYTGPGSINSTWNKFASLYEYVVWYSILPPTVALSGTSAMVYAPLQFVVFPFPTQANPAPHSYVLNVTETLYYTYSTQSATWQLTQEYWVVHPIAISTVASGYLPSTYNATG